MTKTEFLRYVDHSLLRPNLTKAEIVEGVAFARENHCAAVCISPIYVNLAAEMLAGTDVVVATVVGFPSGAHTTFTKVAEAKDLFALGAREVDMVIDISSLLSGDYVRVRDDIAAVVHASPAGVKVIMENHYLTKEEIVTGCRLAEEAGAAFVKTSTGFAPTGATAEDCRLMRRTVSERVKVKAAGGISTLGDALAMLEAGCDRIGISKTRAILEEWV